MPLFILGFVIFGITFSLATARHQHRFNEGSTRKDQPGHVGLWVLLCGLLWPLMLLAGLHNGWRLAQARRAGKR